MKRLIALGLIAVVLVSGITVMSGNKPPITIGTVGDDVVLVTSGKKPPITLNPNSVDTYSGNKPPITLQ